MGGTDRNNSNMIRNSPEVFITGGGDTETDRKEDVSKEKGLF